MAGIVESQTLVDAVKLVGTWSTDPCLDNKVVVECGAGGTCGPNSLSAVLENAGLHEGGGDCSHGWRPE